MPVSSQAPAAALSLADLPPSHETRWVMSRKAKLIEAIHAGLISLEEAAERYRLTLMNSRSGRVISPVMVRAG